MACVTQGVTVTHGDAWERVQCTQLDSYLTMETVGGDCFTYLNFDCSTSPTQMLNYLKKNAY